MEGQLMYQKVIIIGNVGRDPEMRYMPDGTAVTNFSIAANRRWTNRATGEPQEETTWFRISVWGRQAETANEYITKGQRVMVEGRLRPDPQTGGPRVWTGQDGTVGASYEINASNFVFLSGREESTIEGDDSFDSPAAQEEDEIPF
jgi:single-strand DNA-binding protein